MRVSDFGESIVARLPNRNLQNTKNPMNRVIYYTIGEWLQRKNDALFFEQFFLQEATGKYLYLHGQDYGIYRKVNESDEDYRKRIIYESIGHLTVEFLKTVYNVDLYSNIPDFNVEDNVLTSDNPYYTDNGFMGVADETARSILNKKFIINEGVDWIND